MDLMTKLGGRKFFIVLNVLVVAVFLEIQGRGLTPTMAGFLVALVSAFSVTNVISSNAQVRTRSSGDDLHKKLNDLHDKLDAGLAPERADDLKQLLIDIKTGVAQNQIMTGQIGQTLINLGGQKR